MIFIFGITFVLVCFLINCIFLKVSGKIVRINNISIFECFFITFLSVVLSVSIDRVIGKNLDPTMETTLIYFALYVIANVGVFYWILYGISILRAVGFFFVYNMLIIASILIVHILLSIYTNPQALQADIEKEIFQMLEPFTKDK